MPDSHRDIQNQLHQLKEGFSQAIPDKMAEIEQTWGMVGPGDARRTELLHRLAHNLAGNAGTFGFMDLSECARALEEDLVEQAPPARLKLAMENLREAALRVAHFPRHAGAPAEFPLLSDSEDEGPLILVVEDDEFFARDLILQLEGYGYRSEHCESLKDLPAALEGEQPAAIIMDVMHPEGDLAGPLFLSEQARLGRALPPVLFISIRDDLSARLEAVRAGGLGYFTKPLEIAQLISRLEVLVGFRGPDPCRILMIEDSATESTHYAHVLRKAGMQVNVVGNPLQVMGPLVVERPDLILMDLYMPGCSGLELATVIRQQDAFMGIPIVFLSSETDTDRQLRGLSLGGDDFLEKPISPDHLVSSLAARVTRARLLRANMNRDSLTGLLNYGNFKYQLKLELSRAARRQGSLVLAVMDIDQFKAVNDMFGHTVGDRVIRSLARHLQQHLRETDILGRLGGDAFGAILLDTDEAGARNRLDSIRETFSMHHYRGLEPLGVSKPFEMSFSCGISGFPGEANVGADSEALLQMADQALLEAKRQGRNRTLIAGA